MIAEAEKKLAALEPTERELASKRRREAARGIIGQMRPRFGRMG